MMTRVMIVALALSAPVAQAGKSTPDDEWNDGWPDSSYCDECSSTCTYFKNMAELECSAMSTAAMLSGPSACWYTYTGQCGYACGCDYLIHETSNCYVRCNGLYSVWALNNSAAFLQWVGCVVNQGITNCD